MKIDYTNPISDQIENLISHMEDLNEQPSYLYIGKTTYQVLVHELDLPIDHMHDETILGLLPILTANEHHLDVS